MAVPSKWRQALRDAVHQLIVGNYQALCRDGRAGRLTADELHDAVTGYPATLVEIPDEAFELPEPIEYSDGSGWSLDLDLWTAEEGRSDLTLSVSIQERPEGIRLLIENLHVM